MSLSSQGAAPGHAVGSGNSPTIGFVATKPLQIMTSMNVWAQLGRPPALLSVVPNFADAPNVIERLSRLELGFKTVLPARSRALATINLARLGAARVFLDSDIGLKTPMAMWAARSIRPNVRFSLYEEGTGIVKLALEERPNRLLRAMGATTEFGESRLMDEVWTYIAGPVRTRLRDRPVRQIERTLLDFVGSHKELLIDAFWPSFDADTSEWSGGRCCLYLSSWDVRPRAYSYLEETGAYTISKLHPHIRHAASVPPTIDQVLSASIPAELLIMELVESFDTVEVLHHGTATEWYVSHPRVNFVHLDSVETA